MKKFLVVLAIIFAGNIFVSNVHAEIKNYAGRGAALLDFGEENAQTTETAKNVAKLRAIKKAFERAGFFILSFTSETLNGKTTDEYISAIVRDMATIEGEEIKKYYFNSEEYNRPGYIYEANLIAKIDTDKIAKYLQLDATEKQKLIERDKTAKKNFEEIDNEFENLRKTADKKTPAQIKIELEKIDTKISEQNKPVEQKNLPMIFSQPQEIGEFFQDQRSGGFGIKGSISNENLVENPYIKGFERPFAGISKFGNDDKALYIHYDMQNVKNFYTRFGGKNFKNTVQINLMDVTLFKISGNNEITFYPIRKNWDVPYPYEHYVLLGRRIDGTCIKYFDTEDLCKKYFGTSDNVSIKKLSTKASTIIFEYALCNKEKFFYDNKIDERGEFRFKWDDAAQWFGIEKVTY